MMITAEHIPDVVEQNILLYFGESGREWLADLPGIIAQAADQWQLNILNPFPNLSINLVLLAESADATEVVLKAGVPGREIESELEALRAFNGRGTVRLLDANRENGLLLLERLRPGHPASQLSDDDEAAYAAAEIMCQLHSLPSVEYRFPFSTVREWFAGFTLYRKQFYGESGPIPLLLLKRAETILGELFDSTEREILLHGDLHHDNIVSGGRESWFAIDPKGVIGDPCFEVAPFLRNPLHNLLTRTNTKAVLERRLDIFTEQLGYDRQRMICWGIAESVLSAIWDINDPKEGWRHGVRVGEIFVDIIGEHKAP